MKINTIRIIKPILYAFMIVVFMSGYSCSPEDGRDGVDGIQGEQGIPGEDGNANIEVSEWFPIQFDYVDPLEEHGRMHIEMADTWAFVEDGGLVMMFLKQQEPSGNFAITPLPYVTGPLNLYYIFGDMTGSYGVEGFIFFADYPGGIVTDLEGEMFSLRYVLIPGVSGKQALNLTNKPYEEVMSYLGLEY